MEMIKNVSISELHSFRNHPFKVEINTELCELMRSIEKDGVLVPLLVRTNPYGDGFASQRIANIIEKELGC